MFNVSPFFFQTIFLFYCFKWVPVKYGSVEYPLEAHIVGFIMSLASMLWIPGYALYYLATQRGSLKDVSGKKFYIIYQNLLFSVHN